MSHDINNDLGIIEYSGDMRAPLHLASKNYYGITYY